MESYEDKTWSTGAPEKLFEWVRALEIPLSPMRVVDSELLRTYYSTPDGGIQDETLALALVTGNMAQAGGDALRRRSRFNLLKSAIDSYCAMVVQVPSLDVTTTGGSWAQRRSAEALGLFVDGVFAASDMKETAWSCVIDSCLTRVAAVIVEEDEGDGISVTRVLPHQLVWNPLEGRKPRHLGLRMGVPRAALMARYAGDPAKRAAIDSAQSYRPDPLFEAIDGVFAYQTSDMVELIRGWRTSDASGKDGRYVSCIQGRSGVYVLEDEEYKLPMHPIVPLRAAPSYSSYAGSPHGDTLMHYQIELDDFSNTIKEAFVKGAVLRVIVDKGSEVDEKEISNTQGQIIHKNPGTTVLFDHGTTLPPEYIQREQVIIERAFEFLGVSYNAARGVKADGISSGKGQREVAALAQNRLVLNMQTIQDWLVAVAKVVVATADLKYEGKRDIEVKVPGSRLLKRVKWSEIDYRQEDFEIHCDAINALSRHPAARIDEVLELVQGKILTEREGLKVIANKDLQAARDQAFSNEDFSEKIVDLALGGTYRAPDPYMGEEGLAMLVKTGMERYVQELVQDEPSEYMPLLRRLIEAAKTELSQIQPAPAAPASAQMPAPSMSVGGAGLPSELPPAAMGAAVAGQGLA